jgi:eukaryotic-like serine/threonine-protein kinase
MAERDPLIGATVGDRYRIVEEIGSGGMASVFRAEHQLLHKAVAIKVLRPELSIDEAMAARFEAEAIAAARLDHPNVVSTTDFGRTPDGRMYLVMEYLEGTPLDDIIATESRLAWERAVEIVRQTLRGLAHAHDMGVVHRDLKPSNVMVVRHPAGQGPLPAREVAKIIDFGIAKIVGGSQAGPRVETQAGIVFGTADFLAPERLLGSGDSDPRSDLYAIGIILYDALTGTPPFHHEDAYTTVQRALTETAAPPSSLSSDVPPALDAVVLKAISREPEQRFQTARDMLAALDPLVRKPSTGGLFAAPAAPPGRTPTPPRGPYSLPPDADMTASASPLGLYTPPPAPRRRPALLLVPLAAAVILVVAVTASRSADPIAALAPPPLEAPAARPADPEKELLAMVEQAAAGETVAVRQRAFDRLVALGYGDRVPWVPMLARDLEQLPTCEERREIVARMRKISDPGVLPHLQEAVARPENACLAADARAAIARLTGSPEAEGSKPARSSGSRKRRAGGGGHF